MSFKIEAHNGESIDQDFKTFKQLLSANSVVHGVSAGTVIMKNPANFVTHWSEKISILEQAYGMHQDRSIRFIRHDAAFSVYNPEYETSGNY